MSELEILSAKILEMNETLIKLQEMVHSIRSDRLKETLLSLVPPDKPASTMTAEEILEWCGHTPKKQGMLLETQ